MEYISIHHPNGSIAKFSFLEPMGFSRIHEYEKGGVRPVFALVYKDAIRSVTICLEQSWDKGHCDLIVRIDTAGFDEKNWHPKDLGVDWWALWMIEDLYGLEHVGGGGSAMNNVASLSQDWDRIAERLSRILPTFLNDIDQEPLLEQRIQKLEDWKKSIGLFGGGPIKNWVKKRIRTLKKKRT